MDQADVKQLSGLTLAYVGDAAWEIVVRQRLLEDGYTQPNHLHQKATHYVSAKGQRKLLEALQDSGLLTEEENAIYRRGRNAKSHSSAKNADIQTYRIATGFEALCGYLYLCDRQRFDQLTEACLDYLEARDGKENEQ